MRPECVGEFEGGDQLLVGNFSEVGGWEWE